MPFSVINQFDFDYRKCKQGCHKLLDTVNNSAEENKKIMLEGLQQFCMSCRLCIAGCEVVMRNKQQYDPHVFSNMRYKSKYMIIYQNPTIDECITGQPLVGKVGETLDKELEKNGLDRKDFYITSLVHCFTRSANHRGNRRPTAKEKETCFPTFLSHEIKIIQPTLLIALGVAPFEFLCPDKKYQEYLGKITSSRFGKIYTVYYPLKNLTKPSQKKAFKRQIRMLAKLIAALQQK